MSIFDDDLYLPTPSDNPPPAKGNFFEKKHQPNPTFAPIRMTPISIDLVTALKAAAAAFEVELRALSDQQEGALDRILEAYGDMTRVEGALVTYMGRLMDLAQHPELEKRRTVQVKY